MEELGLKDKTLVLFTSDNGPHLEGGADPDFFDSNGPFRGYKRDLYEGGLRVPLIASWPGTVAAGTVSNHVSAFWDWLPTFCELADVSPPEGIDGISLAPELLGKSQPEHDYLYWEFHEQGGKQALRMGDWKGIRFNLLEGPPYRFELYDLASDPSESREVSEAHPKTVAEIERIMEESHTPSELFPFAVDENP